MVRVLELNGTGDLDPLRVGGKAYNLDRLLGLGQRVPRTLVIPVGADGSETADLAVWLEAAFGSSTDWLIAIRSSSAEEDCSVESKAGHFLSLLGSFHGGSIGAAVARVRDSGPHMAVVVQPLIDARFAGVAFSCDPLSFARGEMIIEWTTGLADGLVSGRDAGRSVRVSGDGLVIDGAWDAPQGLLLELVKMLGAIEKGFGCPVDVEWVVDREGLLWCVQARAVVLPTTVRLSLDREAHFDLLPRVVQQHPKLRLRRQALAMGVTMGPAVVEVRGTGTHHDLETGPTGSAHAAGMSIVLLHPERVDRQVVRDFSRVGGLDVDFFARGCRRYSVRRYPNAKNMESARTAVLAAGLAKSWVAAAIVQTVWAAQATGILKRFNDEYVIEIALGHFVPKGVVPTSTAILSHDREVMSVTWREQPAAYHFIDGHVVTETPPYKQLSLPNTVFEDIVAAFEPLFEVYKNAAFEFGVINESGKHLIYLIDVAEGDHVGVDLSAKLISSGVVSTGVFRGRAQKVALSAVGELDRHLHDLPTDVGTSERQDVVIVAERASVELLPLVGAPGIVGFVFERGAVLAHLAVVLREKGVPAVTLNDRVLWEALRSGAMLEVDASDPTLEAQERVVTMEVGE